MVMHRCEFNSHTRHQKQHQKDDQKGSERDWVRPLAFYYEQLFKQIEGVKMIEEKYQLYHGDCLDGFKTLQDESVDLILTDVPYGVDYKNDFYDDSKDYVFSHHEQWVYEMFRVLKEGSHCYIFIPTLEVDKWISAVKKHFLFKNLIATRAYTGSTYLKDNFNFSAQYVIYCSKGKSKQFNSVNFIPTSEAWLKDKRNKNPKPFTYSYPSYMPEKVFSTVHGSAKNSIHPNQKSVPFQKFLIQISTNENDVVLDPFFGSCSCGEAALETGRRFIGFEQDKTYFNLATEKLEQALLES